MKGGRKSGMEKKVGWEEKWDEKKSGMGGRGSEKEEVREKKMKKGEK